MHCSNVVVTTTQWQEKHKRTVYKVTVTQR